MNIANVKEIIKDTGWNFEKYHSFGGVCDRYKDNHDVLVNSHYPNYRIVAKMNGKGRSDRTKWRVVNMTVDGDGKNKPVVVIDYCSLDKAISSIKEM